MQLGHVAARRTSSPRRTRRAVALPVPEAVEAMRPQAASASLSATSMIITCGSMDRRCALTSQRAISDWSSGGKITAPGPMTSCASPAWVPEGRLKWVKISPDAR